MILTLATVVLYLHTVATAARCTWVWRDEKLSGRQVVAAAVTIIDVLAQGAGILRYLYWYKTLFYEEQKRSVYLINCGIRFLSMTFAPILPNSSGFIMYAFINLNVPVNCQNTPLFKSKNIVIFARYIRIRTKKPMQVCCML